MFRQNGVVPSRPPVSLKGHTPYGKDHPSGALRRGQPLGAWKSLMDVRDMFVFIL